MNKKLNKHRKASIKLKRRLVFSLFFGYLALFPAPSTALTMTLENMVTDMQNPHQRLPNGVPDSYDWFRHPIIQQRTPPDGFKAITGWGRFIKITLVRMCNKKSR